MAEPTRKPLARCPARRIILHPSAAAQRPESHQVGVDELALFRHDAQPLEMWFKPAGYDQFHKIVLTDWAKAEAFAFAIIRACARRKLTSSALISEMAAPPPTSPTTPPPEPDSD